MLATVLTYFLGIFFLFLASLFLLYTAYIFYIHQKYSHLPSPKMPSFYLGHVPDILRLRKEYQNSELPLTTIMEYWMQEAGSRNIVVYIFHNARLYTADPDVIKAIVTDVNNGKAKYFTQSFTSLYGERFLGNGVVNVRDHKSWKPKRKLYDPAFNKRYLKGLIPNFNSLVDDFLEKLKPLADGESVVPLRDHIRGFTLSVVSEIIFGSDFTKLKLKVDLPPGYSSPFAYFLDKQLEGCDEALTSFYAPWMHYFHPFAAKGYQEAVKVVRMMGRDCIQRRIKAIENGEETPTDVLTHILRLASLKEMDSLEDLVDDFVGFYIGGYDTTVSMLHFAIILIHQHPEVLSRLLEEIDEVVGDKSVVSAEDVEKLVYTEQVLYETLRMFPAVIGTAKTLHSDLTVGDQTFPADSEVTLMFSVMNSMPEYYENPDLFNPDRFGPGATKPSSFVFFPFGVGHRACIGKHFALMESKIFLSRLLQRYTLTLPEDYELIPVQRVFLHPKDKLPCTLYPKSK